jgi:uncharacterized 2Fe-2S/4Fe-4S cluster protein (DUF4445 family)
MAEYRVVFMPLNKTVLVEAGTTLLEAAGRARVSIDSACGGDGICGRCKMIVREGRVGGDVTGLLTREEIRAGVVLACQATVESDLAVDIPETTPAREKIVIDRDAQRFRAVLPGTKPRDFARAPLVSKLTLQLAEPTIHDNTADCERLRRAVEKESGIPFVQTGLKIIRQMPQVLRRADYRVSVTVGRRHGVGEIMEVEGADASRGNYAAAVDLGTSTVVVHLVNLETGETVDAEACFNSQATYGREVTARMMAAERRGMDRLQRLLVEDMNSLIATLAMKNSVNLKDITSVVCAGNTAMMHFLLCLPTDHIRREPYVPVVADPPPFRAAEVGLKVNPRALLYTVPAIGSWVGGDITAGILISGLSEMDEVGMLIDVGTNGEVVLGNKDWMIACSASAGPALEGAGVQCGMMAQRGAIEKVFLEDGALRYEVIGGGKPEGLCGSGVIDLVAALLEKGVLDRSGKFMKGDDPAVRFRGGFGRYVLAKPAESANGREISLNQEDMENVITAKAAIFAATKILLEKTSVTLDNVSTLFVAGGFGNYINSRSAIRIGLLPDLPPERIRYVGNTSIWGAKIGALSFEAWEALQTIADKTTYYDLIGTSDYVDQFRQAMFLPHTNIELFPSARSIATAERGGT